MRRLLRLAAGRRVVPTGASPALDRLVRELEDLPRSFEELVPFGAEPRTATEVSTALGILAGVGVVEEALVSDDGKMMAVARRPRVGARTRSLLPCRLRRETFLRYARGRWMIANPSSSTVIETASSIVLDVCRSAATELPLGDESRCAIVSFLDDHGFVETVFGDDKTDTIEWEFHDALLHGVSVQGTATSGGYGATYPYRGRLPPPVAACMQPASNSAEIDLPSSIRTCASLNSLSAILALRHSTRRFREALLPLSALSDLLAVALGVRTVTNDGEDDAIFHAYPSGGARGEISPWLIVGACEGLTAGFYEYQPRAHRLWQRIASLEAARGALRVLAIPVGAHPVAPAAALVLTADYARVAWKYEAIAYATILRNVGAIYQTVALTAAAIGIGACALGGGWGALSSTAMGPFLGSRVLVGAVVLGASDET